MLDETNCAYKNEAERKKKMKRKHRGKVAFFILFFLLLFFNSVGYELNKTGNIEWTAGLIMKFLFIGIMGALVGDIGLFLLVDEDKRNRIREFIQKIISKDKDSKEKANKTRDGNKIVKIMEFMLTPWISFLLIIATWIPCYLAYYPGICSYDFQVQMEQIQNLFWIDHHPQMHTWLIYGFWSFGRNVLHNTNLGIALFSFIQMCVLAASFIYGIKVLTKHQFRIMKRMLLLLFAIFYPFHMFMGISMTKDVLFAAFFYFLLASIADVLLTGENQLRLKGIDVVIFLVMQPVIWFRNNARYSIFVFLLILLCAVIFSKKKKLYTRMLITCGSAVIVALIVLSATVRIFDIQQGDRKEMLSMPMQQLARTLYYHEGELDQETREFLSNVILDQAWNEYNPTISDPVKRHFYTKYIKDNAKEFIKVYVSLGLAYPGDYVNAALALDAGYLYIADDTCTTVNMNGNMGAGYVQTKWVDDFLAEMDITKQPILPGLHTTLEQFVSYNSFMNWPIIKYLLLPGIITWIYAFLGVFGWYKRKYRMLIPMVCIWAYLGTLFLGPVVQLRYIYPLIIVLPFMWMVSVKEY